MLTPKSEGDSDGRGLDSGPLGLREEVGSWSPGSEERGMEPGPLELKEEGWGLESWIEKEREGGVRVTV